MLKKSILFFFFSLTIIFSKSLYNETDNIKEKYIFSKILNEQRKIVMYEPKEYTDKKLPVVYVLDAQYLERFNEAVKYSKTNPHIVIGIVTLENRSRDMIPVKMKTRKNTGGSEKFLDFFTKELIPEIDKRYNTNGNNILFGGSNAGLFVLYTIFKAPDSFYGFIPSSPMVGHCPEFMYKLLNEFDNLGKLKNKYVYFHYGMNDHYKQATEFIPDYVKSFTKKFGSLTKIYNDRLEEEGHVPPGGLFSGLKFIYKEKK